MYIIRRASERYCRRRGKREVWLTMLPHEKEQLLLDGFGTMELLSEERIPPLGRATPNLPHVGEMVTYVHEGSLTYERSGGPSAIILAGEFQRMGDTRGRNLGERNASPTEWTHLFRLRLKSSIPLSAQRYEQKRFSVADRRGRLCIIASPDGRGGSLHLDVDAEVYSAVLHPGQHIVHELLAGRRAWLHIVQGTVDTGWTVLMRGDGIGISEEPTVSLTAKDETTVLLVDVGELPAAWSSMRMRAPTVPAPPGAFGSALSARPPAESKTLAQPTLSGNALFALLWDTLVEVLGTAGTAALLGRAARKALPGNPDLGEFTITRVNGAFGYLLPGSFAGNHATAPGLQALLRELHVLLVLMTGQTVLHRFAGIPEFQGWAAPAA